MVKFQLKNLSEEMEDEGGSPAPTPQALSGRMVAFHHHSDIILVPAPVQRQWWVRRTGGANVAFYISLVKPVDRPSSG